MPNIQGTWADGCAEWRVLREVEEGEEQTGWGVGGQGLFVVSFLLFIFLGEGPQGHHQTKISSCRCFEVYRTAELLRCLLQVWFLKLGS